ncbi:MAG TPA: hypothetical protein VFR29_02315 [Steroidobacteraceae bacterium]|nr:hypothetical protein [Steroidobacteraceae bacterium]
MRATAGVLLLVLATVPPAQAYIDPGTGSMLLQVIGAAVAGAIFYFRELRIKILSWFGRRPAGSAEADGQPPADDARR